MITCHDELPPVWCINTGWCIHLFVQLVVLQIFISFSMGSFIVSITLGFLCRRYPELMAEREVQSLYSDILKHPELPKLQCQVIENLHEYFEEQVGKGEETDSSDVSGVRQGKSRSHEDDKVKSVDWGDTKSG